MQIFSSILESRNGENMNLYFCSALKVDCQMGNERDFL